MTNSGEFVTAIAALAAVLAIALVVSQRRHRAVAVQLRVVETERDQVRFQAQHDPVTGLVNRGEFLRLVDQRLRAHASLGVVVVDLDGIQRINDSLGSEVGDAALAEVAERIQAELGTLDEAGRLTGDKFGALLRGVRSQIQAEETARRVSASLMEPLSVGDARLTISARIGVAVAREGQTHTAADLVRDADIAVARARQHRAAGVAVFDDRDRQAIEQRHVLERDLRHANERGELELFLQPLVAADTLAAHGFEALIRWRHPVHGMVSPVTFIPIAEETGLILEIGTWVLEEGCRILRRLHERSGSVAPYLSLNVSGHQLMDPALPMRVALALGASGAPAARLVLEVTETVMMDDIDTGLVALEEFTAMGLGIALDDFGTGYSSLSYLSRVPATILKVDRSFVQRVRAGTADRRIVGAVIGLAHSLGLRVVAEGVETEEEADVLNRLGADVLQGYWIARPMPADDAIEWFVDRMRALSPTAPGLVPTNVVARGTLDGAR